LGTQNGREVEIVNTFELAAEERKDQEPLIDHTFLQMRREQCKRRVRPLKVISACLLYNHDLFTNTLGSP
jgi:COP9 signalosome complex subunit 6